MKKFKKILIRNFILPILLTLTSFFILKEISTFKEGVIYFCVAFFINFILDKTLMQWSINQGKKFKKSEKLHKE